jgi:tetratricopeptide (TPR) repeat protein
MDTAKWAAFPYENKAFRYPGDKLADAWSTLHRGDTEPLPDDEGILEAWRHFHAGDFAAAVDLAEEAGLAGHAVANKASGIYADYLEESEEAKIAIYQAGIRRAEAAIAEWEDDANAHYFHAFLLGRYSQSISIAQALAQGIGGKVRESLENALSLSPNHAEAHTALGLYHAEILDKVGKLIGSMTYGASESKSLRYFKKSLELTPDSPIARIEYANGLYLLFGDDRYDEVSDLYVQASEAKPLDAMEKLDVEAAIAELE